MTPTESVTAHNKTLQEIVDPTGRRITIRRLNALDTLRLFKAAGPDLAHNQPWLSIATLAFSVVEIDGVPVPSPGSEAQIERLVERLGDEGLAAIADTVDRDENSTDDVDLASAGNLPGTRT